MPALAGLAAGLVGVAVAALPAAAIAQPTYQMPFACGETWEGSSRSTHSPSALSIDWNRDAHDLGHPVVATAPGVVTSVVDLGNRSYGLYVIIDHGGGWTTLHAHLLQAFIRVGQYVDQGQVIALLGSSGGSTGPHLHYEQRLNRSDQHASFNGARFRYDSWLRSRNCADVPIAADWNGDRIADVGVFARWATGAFRMRMPSGDVTTTRLGASVDQPVVGDWNGDGQADPGVWSAVTRRFTLATADGGRQDFALGDSNDLPVAGDWNGDGRWDVGVFDAASGLFTLRNAGGNVSTRVLGRVSSLPVAGDWDGDGRWDVGVYEPSTSTFTLSVPGVAPVSVRFGTATSLPVVGDWNGDGRSDVGVWDRATGVFSQRVSANRVTTITFGHAR